MNNIKNTVAKNICELRLMNNMTQMELAERLNYSDKTISKWERAESSPDISVLVEIAEMFGVSLDYLVTEKNTDEKIITEKLEAEHKSEKKKYNRRMIAYVVESSIWFVAIFAFIITTLVMGRVTFQWLYFNYALPVTLIVKLVFNSVWFNPRRNYLIISAMMWSILSAIHISFLYFGINVALIYLIGLAGQVIIVLCSLITKPKK